MDRSRKNTPIFDKNVIIDLLDDLLLAYRGFFFDFVLKQAYIQIAGTRRVRDVVYLHTYLLTFTLRIPASRGSVPTYLGIYRTSENIYTTNTYMYPKYIH